MIPDHPELPCPGNARAALEDARESGRDPSGVALSRLASALLDVTDAVEEIHALTRDPRVTALLSRVNADVETSSHYLRYLVERSGLTTKGAPTP